MGSSFQEYHIADISLADEGKVKVEWAAQEMPVLQHIRQEFATTRPFKGKRIAGCLHITTETANLALTLQAGGAEVFLCASNPLSTQDEVAAALVHHFHIPVFAIRGEDSETYYQSILRVLDPHPQITLDDGADLITTLHQKRRNQVKHIIGGTEETTTGVIRLKQMQKRGVLAYPVIAVNEARTKYLFDNRYGTGQSTLDGILRATNILLAGKKVVVAGYGWCGRGIALRARGMGAQVMVTEVDPIKALEAVMDGFQVLPSLQAASVGDIFITATGDLHVFSRPHFQQMKDGAILANAGHFNVEVDVKALEKMSRVKRRVRPSVEEYTLKNGKRIYLLAEGRLVNLAAAEGHPASVMDLSFANQALSCLYLLHSASSLKAQVYPVPESIDQQVARWKLQSLGISIDSLSPEQKKYLQSWEMGT